MSGDIHCLNGVILIDLELSPGDYFILKIGIQAAEIVGKTTNPNDEAGVFLRIRFSLDQRFTVGHVDLQLEAAAAEIRAEQLENRVSVSRP